jgi:hypothetical protein
VPSGTDRRPPALLQTRSRPPQRDMDAPGRAARAAAPHAVAQAGSSHRTFRGADRRRPSAPIGSIRSPPVLHAAPCKTRRPATRLSGGRPGQYGGLGASWRPCARERSPRAPKAGSAAAGRLRISALRSPHASPHFRSLDLSLRIPVDLPCRAGARVNCVHGDDVNCVATGGGNGADGCPRAALAGGDLAGAI